MDNTQALEAQKAWLQDVLTMWEREHAACVASSHPESPRVAAALLSVIREIRGLLAPKSSAPSRAAHKRPMTIHDLRRSTYTVREVEELVAERDEARAKLAALVEAAEGVLKYRETGPALGAWRDLIDALRAARGEP